MRECMSRRERFAWQHLDKPWPSWFKGRKLRLNRAERQWRKLRPCRNSRHFDVRFVDLGEL